MKKILFAATVLCMMGCQNKPTNSTPALDPSNMDTSVAPNESFYQYATGGWQAKNPLKPEHSSYNMFNVLSDINTFTYYIKLFVSVITFFCLSRCKYK